MHILDHGLRDSIHFHEPARSWSNSTNLIVCSPTQRTFPLVVQHVWSYLVMNLFVHNNLKCVHETYEPPRSYPHTRVHPNTNLPIRINHVFPAPLRTSPLVIHASISQTKTHHHAAHKIQHKHTLPLHHR